MFKTFRARGLAIFLTLLGCSGEHGNGSQPSAGGAGGATHASAGKSGALASAGASANVGSGGHGGGSGSGGSPNSANAGAGLGVLPSGGRAGGSAGASSTGGSPPFGVSGAGNGGAAGSGLGGSSGGSGGSGPAPTFTMIYNTIITPSCGGTQCHLKRPTPFGYDFSSKSAASASWRADVIPGDGLSSPMFQVLNFAIMPKDKPPLSIEQLYMVLNWIDAGALDN